MAESRVVPSGKVYRQMFDAQAHLSLSLLETRRRRLTKEGCFSGDDLMSRDTDSGPHHSTGANQCTEDMTRRNQQFLGNRPTRIENQVKAEEVQGLPDKVVSAKTGSDIIERLTEKKQRDHTEVIAELQGDLSVLCARFEPLLKQAGEGLLLRLLESDSNRENLMQKTENDDNLQKFSIEDLHQLWNTITDTSITRRKWIQELDETYIKLETERASMISALLKKYARKLEKIGYMMPSDVHRLIDSEAMMINSALLANKRAIAKLHLNLMENDLRKEYQIQSRWKDRLQDWKRMKVLAAVCQFRDFINSPQIQRPRSVQETLSTLWTKQEMYNKQRIRILEQTRTMIPPRCSKSLVSEWFSSLCSVNKQIDCMHVGTVTKLHKYYENTWQDCLAEIEHFKNEVSTYGVTSNEIQDLVNAELLPAISKCQMQTEERLAAMDKAFKDLAKTAALLSKSMFTFMNDTARLWEVHTAGLQKREEQFQDHLDDVRSSYDQENQKKEAHLHVLMDKLRQESTKDALKAALEKTLGVLEEVKGRYITFYKESVHTVESYPAVVLQELDTYSSAVSRYFGIKEVYSQDVEELQKLYPSLKFGELKHSYVHYLDTSLNARRKEGRKPCTDVSLKANSQAQCSIDSVHTEEHFDCVSHEFTDSQGIEAFSNANRNIFSNESFVMSCDSKVDANLVEVERVLFPESLLLELQKIVKEEFLNHLKDRYQSILNITVTFVDGKKEELKSELELRLNLQQAQAKRIQMDIPDVRAAELSSHQDCVDRHCKGILQTLADVRTDYTELQVRQQELTEGFCTQIYNMEETFKTSTKSDKLVKLCASLQTSLSKHTNVIQEQQRHFRQNAEAKFEGLREANAKFMKSFKLFSEGGNFTPIEIEAYQKHLEKSAKHINSADEALMLDMEGAESKWTEQAKDVIGKFEEKFRFLTVDLVFLEKIQRVLTHTQVQIKAEVMKSNMQKKMINTMMSELEELIHVCTEPPPHKKDVSSEDITSLTNSLIEELKKRCQYLDCFVDPSMAVPLPDVPLQGAFAVATRPRSRKQENRTIPTGSVLLRPSCKEVDFMNDMVVGVIKGLLRFSKPKAGHEIEAADKGRRSAAGTAYPSVPAKPRSSVGSCQRSGRSQSQTGLESVSSQSMRRFSQANRLDKRFQVFGSKPEDQQGIIIFKSSIRNILWKANNVLLQVAEDYYKRKERRPVSRPQHIQDTFEQCAEELNKRLLVYQSQSQEYRNRCVEELHQQLKKIEKNICKMPEVILKNLTDQYKEDISKSMELIHQQFEQFQQQTEQKKKQHIGQLRVRLSHPAYEEELSSLIMAEQDRQEEQRKAVHNYKMELQACIRKNADEFVTALATSTESLLFQLDKILTAEEIQGGVDEEKTEDFSTLVFRKHAGTPSEDKTRAGTTRGSTSWPGMYYFGAPVDSSANQQQQRTATITTAKTTLGHVEALEVRNTLHQSYEQRVMAELKRVEKVSQQQEAELLHWREHWREQLKILSTLNP